MACRACKLIERYDATVASSRVFRIDPARALERIGEATL
jgi:hypothetical protein